MTVKQTVEYLLSNNSRFKRDVIYDKDRRGHDFCEMIIENKSQPSFPITLTVNENGCSIAVGQFYNVTGSDRMTPDEANSAIEDIIADKIIFALGYNDDGDIGFEAPYLSRVFALTEGNDDMSEDYERFIEKISKPINPKLRFMYSLKGRFLIFNYSGSLKKTIIR